MTMTRFLLLALLALVGCATWFTVSLADGYATCAELGADEVYRSGRYASWNQYSWRDDACYMLHTGAHWRLYYRDPLPVYLALIDSHYVVRGVARDPVWWNFDDDRANSVPPLVVEDVERWRQGSLATGAFWPDFHDGEFFPAHPGDRDTAGVLWVTGDSASRWLAWSASREVTKLHASVRVKLKSPDHSRQECVAHRIDWDPEMHEVQQFEFTPEGPPGTKAVMVHRMRDDPWGGMPVYEEPGCSG